MAPEDSSLDGQGPSAVDDPPPLPRPDLLFLTTPSTNPPPTTFSLAAPSHPPVCAAAAAELQQNGHSKTPDAASEMSNHHHHHQHYLPDQGHHAATPYPPRLPSSTPTYHMPYSPYGSPTTQTSGAHRPNPPVSSTMPLPSMRTIDSMAQQASQGMSPSYGANLPAPPPVSSMSYYPGHKPPTVLPSNYGISPEALARYALPPDPRVLHRPPKKEIKRRTKTGCLTCRKRRIKCDETHPTCNNCRRSKRDCLGYDPIFRQQTIGSNNSQSTTSSASRSSSAVPSEYSRASPTPTPHSNQNTSLCLGTPVAAETLLANSYDGQPSPLTNTYTPTPHPVQSDALPSASTAPAASSKPAPPQRELPTPVSAPLPVIKTGPGEGLSHYFDYQQGRLPSITQPNDSQPASQYSLNHPREVRKMRVEELINSWGPAPAAPESIRSEDTYQEVVKVYHEMYAPGFHAFFESTWFYFSENGKMSFPRYENLVGHMAVFLKVLEGVKVNDYAQMTYSGVLELRLIWELARMAASAAPDNVDNRMCGSLPPENDPIEVMHRFRVVDALLGGELLPFNPLAPPVQDPNAHRTREFDFWYQLGEFLRRHNDAQGQGQDEKPREDALSRLRWLLDGRENRDVLYSIAVLRHYAHRFDMSQALQAKYHLPEEDPQNRVVVASKFISAQAHVTGGTTNVVRRMCDIASQLYVNPSDNARGAAR